MIDIREFPTAQRVARRHLWFSAAGPAAVVTLCWVAISAILVAPSQRTGEISYVDADCYMRLERVTQIAEKGQYPFLGFPRSNPPIGETSHWGMPLDIVLIAGAKILAPVTGSFSRALELWSVWVGPALFGAFAFTLMICGRRFGGSLAAAALGMLLLGSQAILHPFLPARPDHHGLLLLLHAMAFALFAAAETSVLRGRRNPPGGWALLGSAAVLAAAVWASVESFVLVALLAGWLALRVVYPGASSPGVRAGMLLRWSLAHGLALLAAWCVERGGISGPLAWGTDSLSPRFLAPAGCALVSAWALRKPLSSQSRNVRLLAIAATAVVAVGSWMIMPMLAHQKPDTDFGLMLGFLDKASTDGMPMFGGPVSGARNFLEWYGFALPLLPFAVRAAFRARGITGLIGRLVSICAMMYAVLGFLKMRWCPYAMMFAAPLIASWLAALVLKRFAPGGPSRLMAWTMVLTAATAVGFGGRIAASYWPIPAGPSISKLDLDSALRIAADAWRSDIAGQPGGGVLTHVALGPQIMYRWRTGVIATPNVRNGAGIRRLFHWLLATNRQGALQELKDAGWTHAVIVSDPLPAEVGAYRQFINDHTDIGKTLLGALQNSPEGALVGQWPVGHGSTTLRLIRLPRTDEEVARWSAPARGEP